jgi:broad specificity phosphatase PhoE
MSIEHKEKGRVFVKIFLIRHGESTANVDGNYISRTPDHLVSLTDIGIEQANTAGKWLADYCVQNNISLDNARIWQSPYKRARQTAKEFNKHLRVENIVDDIALVEQQFGLFDTLSKEEQEKNFPVEYAEYERQYKKGGYFYFRFPQGESAFDVAMRIQHFINTIKSDIADPVFVFAHGVVIKCFLLRWFHYTPGWYSSNKVQGNCGIRLISAGIDEGTIYPKGKI